MRIGLVLGAGGIVGHAYHATVLAALGRVTAWNPDDAEVIIGTSAGSGIGAVIRGGGDPAELIARILEAPSHPDAIDRIRRMTTPEPVSSAGLVRLPAAPTMALSGLIPPWRPRLAPIIAGLLPEGRVHTSVMGEHPRDLHGDRWPDRELWICATSLADGELVVFGREGAPETDVGTAVEASCAIPTYFRQVTVDGVRYVDGGVHSPTNAGLLADRDLDLVVVISPMSGTTGAARSFPPMFRGYFARKLRQELAPIEEAGIPVLVLQPTLDEARVMGFNPMDPAKRVQVMLQSGASALRFLASPAVERQVEILRKAAANPPMLPPPVGDPAAADPPPGQRGVDDDARRRPMNTIERLTHDDSVFLRVEDGIHHMHLASVAVMEGPAPDFAALRSMIAGLLPLVPRYRRRVRFVPFDIQRPVWVDDAHFNIDYHLRHTALPDPGSQEQLRNLVGRVMSQQLDRSKPLWELWVVEGLDDGQWALISKVHHCLVDAVAGSDILSLMLTQGADLDLTEAGPWGVRTEPSDLQLAAGATRDLATNPIESYRVARSVARRVQRLTRDTVDGARRFNALAPPDRGAGSLTGPIGPHRRWQELRLSLDGAIAIGAESGGSVNDVVLAAVAHGFRTLLLHRGEEVERRFIRAFVPVSIHSTDTRERFDNTVSSTFTELPVGVPEARQGLDVIIRQHETLVDSDRTVAGEILTPVSGFAPPLLLSLGMRAATRAVGEFEGVHTITTNVPGPRNPLHLLGCRMIDVYPYIPLRADMRIAVAVYAYDGNLHFGITGDYDSTADLGVFTTGISEGFGQLLESCEQADAG